MNSKYENIVVTFAVICMLISFSGCSVYNFKPEKWGPKMYENNYKNFDDKSTFRLMHTQRGERIIIDDISTSSKNNSVQCEIKRRVYKTRNAKPIETKSHVYGALTSYNFLHNVIELLNDANKKKFLHEGFEKISHCATFISHGEYSTRYISIKKVDKMMDEFLKYALFNSYIETTKMEDGSIKKKKIFFYEEKDLLIIPYTYYGPDITRSIIIYDYKNKAFAYQIIFSEWGLGVIHCGILPIETNLKVEK